ncbi:MAG TPA: protein kinase [Gemmataceae bacterium]|nr:protein kinase [Gemmataceae bacterium]
MPSPTTIDDFVELVRKSGVVDEKKLTAYLDKARAAQTLPGVPAVLAGLLVRDGLLTQFQAEHVLQGKWRGFSLGKYKVLERLGAGGMGTVYLCEHKLMRRRVAVKVLPAARAQDSASLERFYREARVVAALDHPNIVRAYDIDQDDKLHFLVMEHVDGSSLQEIVKKAGPMDVLRACHYIRQSALGLQHAHDCAGIVHRDIKPGNILVDRNGVVKLLDMGLARFFFDEEDVLTKKYDENVLGTADYLAPEQALDSHSVDIRADIYSLGATFYFCLTGRTPFAEGTVAQKLIWHQTRQPKPIRQIRPEVPEGIVAIVEKMMAKDPNQRPQTPHEVSELLLPWTQTPIPPPPEHEMPQLCPAAMGSSTPSDSHLSSGPRTPPSGTDLSPTPRKVWQVSQSTTPAPLTPQPPKSAPPPLPNTVRKNDPPRGSLNLEMSTPDAALSAPRAGLRGGAAAVPQVRAVPTVAPIGPETQPVVSDPVTPTAAPPVKKAPVRAPQKPQPLPSWKDLLEDGISSAAANGTLPRATKQNPISLSQAVGGLPPPTTARRLGWVIVIASGIVLGLLLALGILAWMFSRETNATTSLRTEPLVYLVNSRGENNAAKSISEVLDRLRRANKQAARIIVQDDLAESDVNIDVPNVRIEAEDGKSIRWRPAPAAKTAPANLFTVSKAKNVSIKGFVLDGDDRVDILVKLYHRCSGVKLEDLKLLKFKRYGIWVSNCEGGDGPDRIQLHKLDFVMTQKEQTAVFFSINAKIDGISKNRFFAFKDCNFVGNGTPVKTDDPAAIENIDWPPNVQPVQGR